MDSSDHLDDTPLSPEAAAAALSHVFKDDLERNGYIWTLRFMAHPPKKFCDWLRRHDIDPALVRPRTIRRNAVWKRIESRGLGPTYKRWKVEFKEAMRKLRLKDLTNRVINELCWWLAEDCVTVPDEFAPHDGYLEVEGLDFLPDFMRWVILHPALPYLETEIPDNLVEQVARYEEEYPCPNQAAKTMLLAYRGSPKMIDSLVKDCVKLHFQDMKAANPATSESVAQAAEHARIETLEGVLGIIKPVATA